MDVKKELAREGGDTSQKEVGMGAETETTCNIHRIALVVNSIKYNFCRYIVLYIAVLHATIVSKEHLWEKRLYR